VSDPAPGEGAAIVHDALHGDLRIQVVDVDGVRELRFGGTVQSAADTRDPERIVFPYLRHTVLSLALHPAPRSVLHVGLGAGTLPAFLHRHTTLRQHVLEYFPPVIGVAREWFGFPPDDERLRVEVADAREWFQADGERFDLIALDATGLDVTPEEDEALLAQVRARLNPGGWVLGNLWFTKIARRFRPWRRVFKPVLHAGPFQEQANVVVYAGTSGEAVDAAALAERAARLGEELPLDVTGLLDALQGL
jgi:spermidine synthase